MASRGAKYRIEGEDATGAAFRSVIGNAQSTANKMSGLFKGAFVGISAAAIVQLGHEAIELGDNFDKARTRLKLTAEQITSLAYAAHQSDVDLNSLTMSIQKMQIFMSKAAAGGKEQAETLAAIGVEIKEIKDLGADEQFELIADRINQLASEEDRARAVTEIFGKAGGDLLPMFEKGAAGIRKLKQEAIELGIALSEEELTKLAEADAAVKKLDATWQAYKTHMVAAVAPGITRALDAIGSRQDELRQQILFLEKVSGEGFVTVNPLGDAGTYKDIGTGVFSAEEGEKKLAQLRAELARLELRENLHPELGGRGRGVAPPPGFKDTAAEEAARKAAQKAADAKRKASEEYAMSELVLHAQVERDAKEHFDKEVEHALDKEDAKVEAAREGAEALRQINEEMAKELSEPAQIVKDSFLNAYDDMVSNGKFKWREMLKYMAAEFARRGIAKLFDTLFTSNGSSTSSTGSAIGSVISAIFGGTRDSGGRGTPGKAYAIGKGAQPEMFIPDSSGTFIPRGGLGGSLTLAPVYNIDARGATRDLIDALPGIMKRNNDELRSEIVEGIRSGKYPTR